MTADDPPLEVAAPLWTLEVPEGIHRLDSWGDGYATGDLDLDGVPDVALGTRTGAVLAVDGGTGRLLWRHVLRAGPGPLLDAAADVVDLDGDGLSEVVASATGERAVIRRLDRGGRPLWTALADFREVTDLAYADVTGDGKIDVVAATGNPRSRGAILILDAASGQRRATYPVADGSPLAIDAADLVGDPAADVVVADDAGRLRLLDVAGDAVRWTAELEGRGSDVVVADVNGSAGAEVLSGGGRVRCYTPGGAVDWWSVRPASAISVGDVIDDAFYFRMRTEVVYTDGLTQRTFLLDGSSGEIVWTRFGNYAHTLADVTGDGIADVVLGAYYPDDHTFSFYYIEAVDGEQRLLWRYPLGDITIHRFELVAANLDSDRRAEIVYSDGLALTALDVGAARSPDWSVWPGEWPQN